VWRRSSHRMGLGAAWRSSPDTVPAGFGGRSVTAWTGRVCKEELYVSETGCLADLGSHDWVNAAGEASMPGRYVTLWRRTAEGEWKCFLEIHSPEVE
jgi:hypothetical protein